MTDLPAYSGPSGQCPKCTAFGVTMAYHAARLKCRVGDGVEHLCRTCQNYRYRWAEACAFGGDGR